jgi:amidase
MMPTAPALASFLTSTPAELDFYRSRVMGFTCIAGLGGLPQISIPAGNADGVPIGVSLIGWSGGDEALLDLAVSLSPFCGE